MTVIAFDTLAFSNKLKEAGMSNKLAEVQAEETAKILNDLTTNQLATKQDLKNLELATKQDLKALELATKQDLKDLELKMYNFMVKTATFTVGILASLQTIFHFVK